MVSGRMPPYTPKRGEAPAPALDTATAAGYLLAAFAAGKRSIGLANIASAEKRNRQRIRRRARNLSQLTPMRTYVKRAVAALGTKDAGKISAAIKLAVRHIDKAAQKGVIKKMTASRKISRLVRAARAVPAPG